MPAPITGISSMATKALLAELAAAYEARTGVPVAIGSVGGVDAAKRVAAGEAFDVVVLASDALGKLAAAGHVAAGSVVALVDSPVAVAVRAGAPRPAIANPDEVRAAVLAARTIGTSTGPSGAALGQLFERWGIADAVRAKTVTAPPGTPVGALVAGGEIELGFQQASELIHLKGVDVIGHLPAQIAIITTFSAGVATASAQPAAARALIDFLTSPDSAEAKRRQGMEPA